MAQSASLSLKPSQRQVLALTPQMQQSVKLLQMTHAELSEFVQQQVEGNPFLRREVPRGGAGAGSGASDPLGDWSERIAGKPDLLSHLTQQIRLSFNDPAERGIAFHLLTQLDERGFLLEPLKNTARHLGAATVEVASVLERLQTLDPPGIFARHLSECLSIQLREAGALDEATRILLENLPLLGKRDYAALQKLCGTDAAGLQEAIGKLKGLNPRPAAEFERGDPQILAPDILVKPMTGGGWRIEINPATLPKVLIDREYYAEMRAGSKRKKDREYLSERLQHARWLSRALDRRQTTLLRVAEEIFNHQEGFLASGMEALRPLTLRAVGDALSLHESTVSRAVAHKTVETPRGLHELRVFFSAKLSGKHSGIDSGEGDEAEVAASAVKAMIRRKIAAEREPGEVLSDAALAQALADEGVEVARRTVAKYREQLHMPGSAVRKRELRAKAEAAAKPR